MRPGRPACRSLGSVLLLAVAVSGGCSGSVEGPSDSLPPADRLVMVDEAHQNSHRLSGTLAPLGVLLRETGLTPVASRASFRSDSLRRGFLLVVANALHESNVGDWSLPTPSAFSPGEIESVVEWVERGGSLLLVADHMPFPGAAAELAAAFGVRFTNSFVFDTTQLSEPSTCLRPDEIQVFRRSDGTLADHPVTRDGGPGGAIDSIATFTGQGFLSDDGRAVLTFGPGAVALMPERAWRFPTGTPRSSAKGWHQGVLVRAGRGRVAIFGEAAMFTRQTCTVDGRSLPMGMNAPAAAQNEAFLRNLIGWLRGEI